MRAWLVALAATVWFIVVAAGFLLFADIGFCILPSDPSLRNVSICSTIGTTGSFDIIIMVVGIPVLIMIDHVARNPSWADQPLSTRVMYLWITLTGVIVLLLVSTAVSAGLVFLQVLLLCIGLLWAALFIARLVHHQTPQKTSQFSTLYQPNNSYA